MNDRRLEQITKAVLGRLFIEIEASGRHLHVTREQALTLFGHPLTEKRALSQPGQFLANERVTIVGTKGKFENVAVLGPERKEAQVEISLTDCKTLGITAPIRISGDTFGTPGVTILGELGEVQLVNGVIVAKRHIHMTPEDARKMGVKDGEDVRFRTFTQRPVIFENMTVRVSDKFATFVHIDYDEANACGLETGDLGRILT